MKKNLFSFLLLLMFFQASFQPIVASQPQPRDYLVVNLHNYLWGMFAVFSYVIGALHEYDRGVYSGLEVNFGNDGLYYDESFGPNWWEYYCEPIKLGSPIGANVNHFSIWECGTYAYFTEQSLSRVMVKAMIDKYIKIKPHILSKVNQFKNIYFEKGHAIIGIHYRGTDKSIEAPRVGYQSMEGKINEYIASHRVHNYKIFVATDEQQFLDYMKRQYGDAIISTQAMRSTVGSALHYNNNQHYRCGEEALIDCLLLSKCDILIRTSSNLSLWSGYFNPNLPIILMNNRY